ncbi:MAG: TfoX/Sxy family protein, partial [Hyphomicrobium sp.]
GLGPVTVTRMFGGAGVDADGVMFGLVEGDQLYLKADGATKSAFEAEGQGPFVYDGASGPVTVMSLWRVPERLYDDPDDMVEWARRALGVARSAAARKPKPKPKPKAKPKAKLSGPSADRPTPKAKTKLRK